MRALTSVATSRPGPRRADVAILAETARQNLVALLTGATPVFYVPEAFDGGVQGIVLSLQLPGRAERTDGSRFSVRGEMPLQSTLLEMTKGIVGGLPQNGVGSAAIAGATVSLTVLWDVAMHGSSDAPQLQDLDPQCRAVFVVLQTGWALAWNPHAGPDRTVARGRRCVAVARCSAGVGLQSGRRFHRRSNRGGQSPLSRPTCGRRRRGAGGEGGVQPVTAKSASPITHLPVGANAQEQRASTDIRLPAVAGMFYPRHAEEIGHTLDEWFANRPEADLGGGPGAPCRLGLFGPIGCRCLQPREVSQTSHRACAGHRPEGAAWAVAPHRTWQLPRGCVDSDPELARTLAEAIPGLQLDAAAHAHEHAIEVQLPLIARLAPGSRVVGITIRAGELEDLQRFGQRMAGVLAGMSERPLLVISSDMNHYADDQETRRRDRMALEALAGWIPSALPDRA